MIGNHVFEFRVTEIKQLGKGLSMNLSIRMEGDYLGSGECHPNGVEQPPARYPLHAVVPYSPEFGPVQIGQRFRLVRVVDTLL